jgi:hypothetical protein
LKIENRKLEAQERASSLRRQFAIFILQFSIFNTVSAEPEF